MQLSEKGLARIGPVGQAGVALGLLLQAIASSLIEILQNQSL